MTNGHALSRGHIRGPHVAK